MAATLRDMIQKLFDVKTRDVSTQVAVAVTVPPTLVAKNNPNRLSLIISNPSVNPCYISFDQDMAIGEGIYLAPDGGFVSFLWSEDFDVVGFSVHGIAVGGIATLNILEIVTN